MKPDLGESFSPVFSQEELPVSAAPQGAICIVIFQAIVPRQKAFPGRHAIGRQGYQDSAHVIFLGLLSQNHVPSGQSFLTSSGIAVHFPICLTVPLPRCGSGSGVATLSPLPHKAGSSPGAFPSLFIRSPSQSRSLQEAPNGRNLGIPRRNPLPTRLFPDRKGSFTGAALCQAVEYLYLPFSMSAAIKFPHIPGSV